MNNKKSYQYKGSYLFVIILIFSSCVKDATVNTGVYKPDWPRTKPELLYWFWWEGYTGISCSVLSLELYPDSSFVHTQRYLIEKGKWKTSGDSLICTLEVVLHLSDSIKKYMPDSIISKWYNSDSLAKPIYNGKMNYDNFKFKIEKNKLIRIMKGDKNRILEKLTFRKEL